jgi:uncharacterized protein YnzC (UPF0291/DUF896 family)
MKVLIDEINKLARISRKRPLTGEEQKRQVELRQKYLTLFRNRFRQQLSQIKVVDKKGNDVTPQKRKANQKSFDKKWK